MTFAATTQTLPGRNTTTTQFKAVRQQANVKLEVSIISRPNKSKAGSYMETMRTKSGCVSVGQVQGGKDCLSECERGHRRVQRRHVTVHTTQFIFFKATSIK